MVKKKIYESHLYLEIIFRFVENVTSRGSNKGFQSACAQSKGKSLPFVLNNGAPTHGANIINIPKFILMISA